MLWYQRKLDFVEPGTCKGLAHVGVIRHLAFISLLQHIFHEKSAPRPLRPGHRKTKSRTAAVQNESDIWIIDRDISDSTSNLSLHLIGNLNYFIGTVLGKTGYVRTRADEFTLKNIPLATLTQQLDQTKAMVHATLSACRTVILREITGRKRANLKYAWLYYALAGAFELPFGSGELS